MEAGKSAGPTTLEAVCSPTRATVREFYVPAEGPVDRPDLFNRAGLWRRLERFFPLPALGRRRDLSACQAACWTATDGVEPRPAPLSEVSECQMIRFHRSMPLG